MKAKISFSTLYGQMCMHVSKNWDIWYRLITISVPEYEKLFINIIPQMHISKVSNMPVEFKFYSLLYTQC